MPLTAVAVAAEEATADKYFLYFVFTFVTGIPCRLKESGSSEFTSCWLTSPSFSPPTETTSTFVMPSAWAEDDTQGAKACHQSPAATSARRSFVIGSVFRVNCLYFIPLAYLRFDKNTTRFYRSPIYIQLYELPPPCPIHPLDTILPIAGYQHSRSSPCYPSPRTHQCPCLCPVG